VPVAREVFDRFMPQANQIGVARETPRVTAADLLAVPEGDITEAGIRLNIDVGIRYLASWMNGNGCVPIYSLMEDAATAEISRAQLWQWVRHGARTKEGGTVSGESVNRTIVAELEKVRRELGDVVFEAGRFEAAGQLFGEMVTGQKFAEFLTLAAYDYID
jgi:malate synthase